MSFLLDTNICSAHVRQSAAVFGELRATLLNQGVVVNAVDVMIAAVALQHERFRERARFAT